MSKIMIPVKIRNISEIVDGSTIIKSGIFTVRQFENIRDEIISNLNLLGDHIENIIDRFERMDKDTSIEFVYNTCKEHSDLFKTIQKLNTAFSYLEKHISSNNE